MLVHWIWLATRTVSDRVKVRLLEHFRDPEDIYFADKGSFSHVEGLSGEAVEVLADKDLSAAQEILRRCSREKISILTFRDAGYPARLKNISDPPCVLYYKGRLPDFDGSPLIGVVGTRRASAYGLTAAKRMGFQIAKCGGIVVSGMAYGIDSMAMSGALTAGREVVEHPGGVCILALREDGTVPLVRQFRYPLGRELLEIPAGKLEKGEEPYPAALRELREETGGQAEQLVWLGDYYGSAGFCDEKLTLYFAQLCKIGENDPDEDEFLNVETYRFEDLLGMVLRGEITDAKTAALVMKAQLLKEREGLK